MKTTHKEELYVKSDKLTDKIYDEESIFFDIETTGFSPANSSVYLIGCARRKGKYICIDQYFAENPSEEKIIRGISRSSGSDLTSFVSLCPSISGISISVMIQLIFLRTSPSACI